MLKSQLSKIFVTTSFLFAVSLSFSIGAQMDLDWQRGDQIISHSTNNSQITEQCIIPHHLPNAFYRGTSGSKDIEAEKELCSLSLYLEGTTKSNGAVAVCPKVNGTSTALEFQKIPEGKTKQELEAASQCGHRRPTSKMGKFKTTDNDRTCTYAPGAILTYHLSRAMGNVLHVPPMVLRTVSVDKFQEVTERALNMRINSILRKGYQNYLTAFAAPTRWDYKRHIFTKDFQQVFGMMKDTVKGDRTMPGFGENNEGAKFESLSGVKHIFSSASTERLFGDKLTPRNLALFQLSRDYADLIVLDQLSLQADRYTGGNVSYLDYYFFIDDNGQLDSVKKRDVDKGKKPMPTNPMLVKRLVASDNDCTMMNGNMNARKGYVASLRHLHPKSYQGVMRLAKSWRTGDELSEFLSTDLGMDPRYIKKFGSALLDVADTLKKNCVSGKLKLDLDPNQYFIGSDVSTNCHLN